MNCQDFTKNLDNYLDDALEASQRSTADHHLANCEHCQAQLKHAQTLQSALKNITPPPMSPGFAQKAIRHASGQQPKHTQHHRRGFVAGFSSAIAAGLVLALVVGGLLPTQQPTEQPVQVATTQAPTPEIILSVEEVQMVNVVFDSSQAVAGAQLSLTLPPHVELSGYPGKHNLAWSSDLKQGRNVLTLPLRGLSKANGELIAQINSNGKIKSIRIQLQVNDKGEPHANLYYPANPLS